MKSRKYPRFFFTFRFAGFVQETATFIAEAAEDENDTIVKKAHQFKNTVESLAGNIDV